jgi:hypothetical protein
MAWGAPRPVYIGTEGMAHQGVMHPVAVGTMPMFRAPMATQDMSAGADVTAESAAQPAPPKPPTPTKS